MVKHITITFTSAGNILGPFLLKNDFDDWVLGMVSDGFMFGTQAEQNELVAVHVVVLVEAFFYFSIIFFVEDGCVVIKTELKIVPCVVPVNEVGKLRQLKADFRFLHK